MTSIGKRDAIWGAINLLIDSNRGVYIPKHFAEDCCLKDWHLRKKDVKTLLKGPSEEGYWDNWAYVLDKAYFCEPHDGKLQRWTLYQDGDLWAVCTDLMTDHEFEEFFGERQK